MEYFNGFAEIMAVNQMVKIKKLKEGYIIFYIKYRPSNYSIDQSRVYSIDFSPYFRPSIYRPNYSAVYRPDYSSV